MNNGKTNRPTVREIIEGAVSACVGFDGAVHVEDVVALLRSELDEVTLGAMLRETGQHNLANLVLSYLDYDDEGNRTG